MVDSIGWCVTSDLDVVCLCTQNGSAVNKKLVTIADVACEITRNHGATEAALVDYDLAPMTKAWFTKSLYFYIYCN